MCLRGLEDKKKKKERNAPLELREKTALTAFNKSGENGIKKMNYVVPGMPRTT